MFFESLKTGKDWKKYFLNPETVLGLNTNIIIYIMYNNIHK